MLYEYTSDTLDETNNFKYLELPEVIAAIEQAIPPISELEFINGIDSCHRVQAALGPIHLGFQSIEKVSDGMTYDLRTYKGFDIETADNISSSVINFLKHVELILQEYIENTGPELHPEQLMQVTRVVWSAFKPSMFDEQSYGLTLIKLTLGNLRRKYKQSYNKLQDLEFLRIPNNPTYLSPEELTHYNQLENMAEELKFMMGKPYDIETLIHIGIDRFGWNPQDIRLLLREGVLNEEKPAINENPSNTREFKKKEMWTLINRKQITLPKLFKFITHLNHEEQLCFLHRIGYLGFGTNKTQWLEKLDLKPTFYANQVQSAIVKILELADTHYEDKPTDIIEVVDRAINYPQIKNKEGVITYNATYSIAIYLLEGNTYERGTLTFKARQIVEIVWSHLKTTGTLPTKQFLMKTLGVNASGINYALAELPKYDPQSSRTTKYSQLNKGDSPHTAVLIWERIQDTNEIYELCNLSVRELSVFKAFTELIDKWYYPNKHEVLHRLAKEPFSTHNIFKILSNAILKLNEHKELYVVEILEYLNSIDFGELSSEEKLFYERVSRKITNIESLEITGLALELGLSCNDAAKMYQELLNKVLKFKKIV